MKWYWFALAGLALLTGCSFMEKIGDAFFVPGPDGTAPVDDVERMIETTSSTLGYGWAGLGISGLLNMVQTWVIRRRGKQVKEAAEKPSASQEEKIKANGEEIERLRELLNLSIGVAKGKIDEHVGTSAVVADSGKPGPGWE